MASFLKFRLIKKDKIFGLSHSICLKLIEFSKKTHFSLSENAFLRFFKMSTNLV